MGLPQGVTLLRYATSAAQLLPPRKRMSRLPSTSHRSKARLGTRETYRRHRRSTALRRASRAMPETFQQYRTKSVIQERYRQLRRRKESHLRSRRGTYQLLVHGASRVQPRPRCQHPAGTTEEFPTVEAVDGMLQDAGSLADRKRIVITPAMM